MWWIFLVLLSRAPFSIEPVDDQRKGWTVSVIDGSTDPKVIRSLLMVPQLSDFAVGWGPATFTLRVRPSAAPTYSIVAV